jgi:uncharacterized small protein (DUF1192 family)
MTYREQIESKRLTLCKPGSEYHSGVEMMRELASYIAAEADAEIARLNAEIARMREYEVSNRRALEAWLSGEPSRPPLTGRRKTLAGAGEGGE